MKFDIDESVERLDNANQIFLGFSSHLHRPHQCFRMYPCTYVHLSDTHVISTQQTLILTTIIYHLHACVWCYQDFWWIIANKTIDDEWSVENYLFVFNRLILDEGEYEYYCCEVSMNSFCFPIRRLEDRLLDLGRDINITFRCYVLDGESRGSILRSHPHSKCFG